MSTALSLENKRILVTGATGLIGSSLIKRLLSEGAEVIACGRTEDKLRFVFGEISDNEKLSLRPFSAADALPDDMGCLDYIFHAASPISGAEIKARPVETVNANITGIINCLEYLKKQKENRGYSGRMIVFSSATVYGSSFSCDTSVTENETCCADPLNCAAAPYSESKRMAEVIAGAYCREYGIDAVILRIGYVYGYSKVRPNTAFYEFVNNALCGRDIVLNCSGMGKRDNIYIDDAVEGIIAIALRGTGGEAYNISSDGELGNFAAADEIAEAVARCAAIVNKNGNIKVIFNSPVSSDRKPGVRLNNSKLKKLGWSIKNSLDDGIMKTLSSYYIEKTQDTANSLRK